jgi:hypothetical protein
VSQADVFNDETSRDNLVDVFAERVLREPWGTVAKSQLEQLMFTLLVESGKIRLDRSDFQLANDLQTSTAKAARSCTATNRTEFLRIRGISSIS